MRAGLQDTPLPVSRAAADIDQQGQVAARQVAANALDKAGSPCLFDTQQANGFEMEHIVNFVIPVAFTVRAGANGVMAYAAFAQRFRQAVEQHGFAGVGRPADEEGRKQVYH